MSGRETEVDLFDVTLRPEPPRHRLFGRVCVCGEWWAQCGNDVASQWADHVRTSPTQSTDGGPR